MDAAHDKLYGRIADLLAQEAQKRNGNLVEFPAEVLQVARQILLAAEKREVYPRISCDTTLIPLLYDTIYNKSHPTKELRSFIWFHLNRLLKAGNTDWLKSYWEWASQYYRTMRYNGSYDEIERNEFHEMHLFFAAMVLRNGNKELMEHIMSFQDTLPDPPPLLLYRISEIIQTLLDFDKLRNWPFRLVKNYQMYFFANDVNADHNIFRVLCDYLAFSLLNIVNKQDCNSYTINEYLIDKKIPIERLKKERETLEWFRSIVMIDISKINCEHFSRKQAEAARTLLLGLVKEYDKRIESIKEHDNIDPDKLDALKKEIIVECERMALPLQRKKMDGEDVEQLKFIVSDTAQAAPGQMLEHYSTSSVNFTEVLVAYLLHQFYARLASLFILNGAVATYLIQYNDLGEALRRMHFNKDEYVLLNNGISLWGQDLGCIKREEIIAIGSGSNNLFIIKKDDCPTYLYGTLTDMRQIDKQYEAIDESKGLFWKEPTDNLMVHIAQPYVLYNRRHMRFLKINITYDRALGDCSLHKLKDISEIL